MPAAAASAPAAGSSFGGSSAVASDCARGRALRDAVKGLGFSLGLRLQHTN